MGAAHGGLHGCPAGGARAGPRVRRGHDGRRALLGHQRSDRRQERQDRIVSADCAGPPGTAAAGLQEVSRTLDKGGRLFPDLRQDQFGKWTGNFSKWWGRWARGLGIKDHRKVFHSFRHTFKAACRRAGIQEETHDLLTGHQGASVGRSYGRAEYTPELVKTLAKAVRKIEYRETGLRHSSGGLIGCDVRC